MSLLALDIGSSIVDYLFKIVELRVLNTIALFLVIKGMFVFGLLTSFSQDTFALTLLGIGFLASESPLSLCLELVNL